MKKAQYKDVENCALTERRIIICLPESLDDALREEAHKARISIAEVVRRALRAWLRGRRLHCRGVYL